MSSSLRYRLTNWRTWPLRNRRACRPGYLATRSSRSALTVAPLASTVVLPSACCRMGVGIWTRADMGDTPEFSRETRASAAAALARVSRLNGPSSRQRRHRGERLELLQRRADQQRLLQHAL